MEAKQVNMRIDPETMEEFRNFCEKNHLTQAQGFEYLLSVAALEAAKISVPERATEIEDFERLAKALLDAYIFSVNLGASAEARAKESFAGDIKRKDKIIDELHEKVALLQAGIEAAENAQADAEKAQAAAEEREKNAIEQMDAAKKSVAD